MKAIKLLSVAFAMAFAMNANAQFVNAGGSSSSGESQDYQYYEGYGKDKCMTNELSVYLGHSWGMGWQLRREINPYFAVNIVGVSYLSFNLGEASDNWENSDLGGFINFRFLGARGYSPSWKWIRGYVDLNMGYTLGVFDMGGKNSDVKDTHHFGLDFGVGVQLHKRVAVGYHLSYVTNYEGLKYGTSHYAKISVLF